jgi:hypothetical protein
LLEIAQRLGLSNDSLKRFKDLIDKKYVGLAPQIAIIIVSHIEKKLKSKLKAQKT